MARRIFQIKYVPGEGWRFYFRRPRIFDAEYHDEEEEVVGRSLPRIPRFRPFIDISIDTEAIEGFPEFLERKAAKKREEGKTKIDIE